MTESTGYLDMNKKKTCVIQIKSINSLLFCFLTKGFFVFQTEPNSIDRSIASNPKKNLPPKSPRNTLPSIVSYSLRPEKKKFPCFFQKKIFFPPRPGFELTLKNLGFPHSARQARAAADSLRARRPPLPAAAAARVDMRSASDWNLTMALDLDHGLGP